jgi:hypothetical protein
VDALELASTAMKLEQEMGKRPERMVELYLLMSEIYDAVSIHQFTSGVSSMLGNNGRFHPALKLLTASSVDNSIQKQYMVLPEPELANGTY